ncbi:MAG: Stp1/IreP family PP2C-type Ser/Thr phosphatase [Hyphomonadaceae bacterium]|nr:Stp1/IreP family PP2C-type Ser/Thr phosphatase [Clostridia bacterium]
MKFAFESHVGKVRQQNEDNGVVVALDEYQVLAIVADGMGGHQAGEVASSLAVEQISHFIKMHYFQPPHDMMKQGIMHANHAIYEKSRLEKPLLGMGTTVVLAWLGLDNITIAHVGDSRAYHIFEGKIHRLTKDHSVVEGMVECGLLTPAQAEVHPRKHEITRALGTSLSIEPTFCTLENAKGTLLLCSDGLNNMLSDIEILAIILKHDNINEAATQLVQAANDHGGVDNITVALLELGEGLR